MKKFSFIFMGILALFILIGVGMIIFSEKDDGSLEINEKQLNKTPGLNTLLEVKKIIENEQLEKDLLNIEVSRENNLDHILIELQGNDFVTEDSLLKDTYNIFRSAASLSELSSIEIIWHASLNSKNEPVLSMNFSKENLQQIAANNYIEIPTIATNYKKHESLQSN